MPKSKLDYLKKYSSSSKKKNEKLKVDKSSSYLSDNLKVLEEHGSDYPDRDHIDINRAETTDDKSIKVNNDKSRGDWTSSSSLSVPVSSIPVQKALSSSSITNNVRSDSEDSIPRRPQRRDSGNKSDSDEDSIPRRPQKRDSGNNSDSDEDSIPRREDKGDDSNSDKIQELKKMSSGHTAGLQSGKNYKLIDQEIRKRQKRELESVDANLSGAYAGTVYRDKSGVQQDVVVDYQEKELVRAAKMAWKDKAIEMLNEGLVQRHEREKAAQELAHMSNTPFARTADDTELDHKRKYAIRDGDPMAAYMASKQKDEETLLPISSSFSSKGSGKPMYKGPPAPQNRFNIGPGYRWDGIPRGNGFEEKVLLAQMQLNGKGQEAASLDYY